MSRGTVLALAAGMAAVGLLVGIVSIVGGAGEADAFATRCEDLLVGDDLADVYAWLGPEGYRPGCGSRLPCETLDLGEQRWSLSCTAEDCSQLWKRDDLACMVEFESVTRTLLSAELLRTPR